MLPDECYPLKLLPTNIPRRTVRWVSGIAVCALLAAGVWLSRTTVTEVDIRSGAMRRRTMVCWIEVRREHIPTWMSAILGQSSVVKPDWRHMSRRGPLHRARVNNRWAGGMSSVRSFEGWLRLVPLSPEAERMIAERVVELWAADNPQDTYDLIYPITERMAAALEARRATSPLTPADIGL